MGTKRFSPLYIVAIIYAAAVYAFPALWFKLNEGVSEAASSSETVFTNWPLLLPAALGVVNLMTVLIFRSRISREELLVSAVIIKYMLVPFYIMGGFCIACALLLMFTPVVIMIFVGPAIAVTFSVMGWIAMIGAAPFSLAYIIRSRREGVHGRLISKAAGILQFFFTADVISLMVLALKEKKCVKLTIALLALLIIAAAVICIWLTVKLIGIFL